MDRKTRAAIAPVNAIRIPEIIKEHPTASTTSSYYKTAIPKLDSTKCPKYPPAAVSIIRDDTFTAAKSLLEKYGDKAKGKICVMNMASDKTPGGGYLGGSRAQEECLCYRSTLYPTLDPKTESDGGKTRYPLPPLGCIYTPEVVVFRDELTAGNDSAIEYKDPKERFSVSVVSLAGLRQRHVDLEKNVFKSAEVESLLRVKIRQVLRACAMNGASFLVLGAIGCGAFRNPPVLVAKHFRSVLEEEEFMGWFEEVAFGILDSKKEGNAGVFEGVMKGCTVGSPAPARAGEGAVAGGSLQKYQKEEEDSKDWSEYQTRIFDNKNRRGGRGGKGRGGGRGRGNGEGAAGRGRGGSLG